MQEIGRAGRDGSPSVSILLRAPGDTELQQQIIQTESLSDYDLEGILPSYGMPVRVMSESFGTF